MTKYNLLKCFKQVTLLLLMMSLITTPSPAQGIADKNAGYLFVYFTGNSIREESIHFALSNNGYNFYALNHDNPVLSSKQISATGGVRDPHILRGADGKTFYMVATDMVSAKGWDSNRGMVMLKSADLVNWTSTVIDIQKRFPGNESLLRVWAPQTIYDTAQKKYMLYWSMKHGKDPDKIYYAYANADFTDLETEPRQLFFSPTNGSCIDGDITFHNGKYNLFFKTEGRGNGIKKAVSSKLTEGYVLEDKYLQQTTDPVEGASVFKLNNGDDYILMYDVYTKGKYQFTRSKDLENFSVIDQDVTMDFHPRHGTVLPITKNELKRLRAKWPSTMRANGNNPVLKGLYADPEIIYSRQMKRYYIYPTTDGFTGWSGTYFKTFSSADLVNWKDEGVTLDLVKDVDWAKRNAWAPTITEQKVNGKFRYFYYFTAAQKIGVAVADHPAGPFRDSGKPVVSKRPAGIKGGQEIDPDVFTDPKTGKSYLYWGNGYMACAALNPDMLSIDTSSIQIMTPSKDFREGTEVFYRNGKYYFLWSEDDTRSENYHVRYGYSDSPTGKITIPEDNLILSKDPENGIYGTGHNSVIQVPGKDEWYIVYHRFNRPKGITMGDAAGFNREVCIDRMQFSRDGSIKKVIPTVAGIKPIKNSN